MILSHTHRFIFFCGSKVGSTSMEEVLRPLQEGAEYDFGSVEAAIVPKHVPPAILKGALPEKIWNEYYKFVFVRNPWDWFISQWFYNSLATDPMASLPHRMRRRVVGAVRTRLNRPGDGKPEPLIRNQDELRLKDVDALFDVLKRFKQLPGRDGLYQSNSVYDMDDRPLVDYVGRYETLEADFDKVMDHLGLDLHLPHLNRTEHRDYRSYYSTETRERVAQLWEVDIENFGYSFDRLETFSADPGRPSQ